jgi:hypothetical protein
MTFLRSKPFLLYLGGLGAVAAGAGVSAALHSMWPLALGSSFAVLCTAGLVKALRRRTIRGR